MKRHFNCKLHISEEIELAKIYTNCRFNCREIAKAYGNDIGWKAIRDALVRQGVQPRIGGQGRGKFFDEKGDKEVARLYQEGMSITKLWKHYNLHGPNAVTNALKREGITIRPNRTYFFNEKAFDLMDSELPLYWLGFIYADGTVNHRALRFGLAHKDKIILERFRQFMDGGMEIRVSKNCISLEYHHIELTQRLQELGIIIRRGSFHLTEPHIPIGLEHHFIRGYLDGDGCISHSEQVIFLGQLDILKWIKHQLITYTGASQRPTFRQRQGIHEISWGGLYQAKRIINFLYQDATIWLERKKEIAENWRKKSGPVKDHSLSNDDKETTAIQLAMELCL